MCLTLRLCCYFHELDMYIMVYLVVKKLAVILF